MPKYAIVMTEWETDEDTTMGFADSYEEAVKTVENWGATRSIEGDYWYNSAEKYTIEELE